MKLVAISDTHLRHVTIPSGEILLHAGDLAFRGNFNEIVEAFETLKQGLEGTNFKRKFLTPGNHDGLFQESPGFAKQIAEQYGWTLLHNELIEFEGIRFFGSAIQPIFGNWYFNEVDGRRANFWDGAPDCDVLVTHCPAHGLRDELQEGGGAGCRFIRKYIDEVKPKLHVCGHLHYGYGQMQHGPTTIINSACCDDNYRAVNKPLEFTYVK
jgi:Icc-related predicted phosphoesterase